MVQIRMAAWKLLKQNSETEKEIKTDILQGKLRKMITEYNKFWN